ncbi:hypothetical protein ACOME3_004640 [Neoechinorhynchus agilis]
MVIGSIMCFTQKMAIEELPFESVLGFWRRCVLKIKSLFPSAMIEYVMHLLTIHQHKLPSVFLLLHVKHPKEVVATGSFQIVIMNQSELRAIITEEGNAGFKHLCGLMTKHENMSDSPSSADEYLEESDIYVPEAEGVRADLSHARLREIAQVDCSQNVVELNLRNNQIKEIKNLGALCDTLKRLDLYGNQITEIKNLSELRNLVFLDLSFNRIRIIEGLDSLVKLESLFLIHNGITEIDRLDRLEKLSLLELGDNRIKEIKNLDKLKCLVTLHLGNNSIKRIDNLSVVGPTLQLLSLTSNRLSKIEGLDCLAELRELYLAENGIDAIDGLQNCNRLEILDLTSNRLTFVHGIEHLQNLNDLWLGGNKLSSWDSIDILSRLQSLIDVRLEDNPLQKQDRMYRKKLMLLCPKLLQIDATATALQSL